ncbi:hypothetical protein V1478_005906 [Vespula squamosa]|uniref:Ribosomal protein S14 n=1 Tax=Vespula squamosa TaxID=30214 RepID=A0ABD2BA56_VESSQ
MTKLYDNYFAARLKMREGKRDRERKRKVIASAITRSDKKLTYLEKRFLLRRKNELLILDVTKVTMTMHYPCTSLLHFYLC